ncbi:MAG: hypothetical protein WC877_00340 [Dehalococcoidales bacterium]
MDEVICHKCEYFDWTDEEEWCNNSGELLGDITCGNTTKSECDDFREREIGIDFAIGEDRSGYIFCKFTKCEKCGKLVLGLIDTEHHVCQECKRVD